MKKKLHHSLHTRAQQPLPSSSSVNNHYNQLHPKNKYASNPPNLYQLAKKYPQLLGPFVQCNEELLKGKIDWKNFNAVKALTLVLLWEDFGYQIDLPDNYLCPPIPNRLNYLCWLSDLFEGSKHLKTTPNEIIVDIGTGASMIYPLLGIRSFGWDFIGVDINPQALDVANHNLQKCQIQQKSHLLLVPTSDSLQQFLKDHYLPIILEHKEGPGLGELYLQYFNHLISNQVEIKLSKQDLIYNYRGQIRNVFALFESNFQYRLSDCEHEFFSTRQASHPERIERNHQKKSKRRSFDSDEEDEEDDDEDDNEDIPNNVAGNILSTARRNSLVSAVMTNPPFYDIGEQVMENEETVCSGNEIEMKTVGGEVAFITSMILDSLILKESVIWYTAMVGKKSSLKILKSILTREGIPRKQIFTTTFAQGVTHRWGLAWTFLPEAAALYQSSQLLNSSSLLPSSQTPAPIHSVDADKNVPPSSSDISSLQLQISPIQFFETMTQAERLQKSSFLDQLSFLQSLSPECTDTLLELASERIELLCGEMNQALISSSQLSKFPEMIYLSTMNNQLQSVQWNYSCKTIIIEKILSCSNPLMIMHVEIFLYQNGSSSQLVPTDLSSMKSIVTVEFGLQIVYSSAAENGPSASIGLLATSRLASCNCSQNLAR